MSLIGKPCGRRTELVVSVGALVRALRRPTTARGLGHERRDLGTSLAALPRVHGVGVAMGDDDERPVPAIFGDFVPRTGRSRPVAQCPPRRRRPHDGRSPGCSPPRVTSGDRACQGPTHLRHGRSRDTGPTRARRAPRWASRGAPIDDRRCQGARRDDDAVHHVLRSAMVAVPTSPSLTGRWSRRHRPRYSTVTATAAAEQRQVVGATTDRRRPSCAASPSSSPDPTRTPGTVAYV